MMRILIVDDEPIHARFLTNGLKSILGASIESVQVQKTLTAAECYLLDNAIDLLFLDLNLYGENGFELLERVGASSFLTIVVSAHTEMALQAFDWGVLDFVSKPIQMERLEQAVKRYQKASSRSTLKNFPYYEDGVVVQIPLEKIFFFEAEGKQLILHMRDGTTRRCYRPIGHVIRILPAHFRRIHRSYIVDIHSIQKMQSFPGGRYEVVLTNDIVLPVSRALYAELKSDVLAKT